MSRLLRFLARTCAVLAIAGVAVCGAVLWQLRQPLTLPATPYPFDVKQGASLTTVARDLTNAGVLPGERWLTALGRVRGVDRAI
ncbi:MAG: hypothetical protein ABI886_08595, partial [Betaproteobacteria bacterium]